MHILTPHYYIGFKSKILPNQFLIPDPMLMIVAEFYIGSGISSGVA